MINERLMKRVTSRDSPSPYQRTEKKASARHSSNSSYNNMGRSSTERPVDLRNNDSQSGNSSFRQEGSVKRRNNISKPTFHGGIYDPNSNDTAFLLPYIEDPDKRQKLEQLEQRILNRKFNSASSKESLPAELDRNKSQDQGEETSSVMEKMLPVKF